VADAFWRVCRLRACMMCHNLIRMGLTCLPCFCWVIHIYKCKSRKWFKNRGRLISPSCHETSVWDLQIQMTIEQGAPPYLLKHFEKHTAPTLVCNFGPVSECTLDGSVRWRIFGGTSACYLDRVCHRGNASGEVLKYQVALMSPYHSRGQASIP
jgi:hypothetical protein